MGLLKKLFGKKSLYQDILNAADWVVGNLNESGYKADYSLESMKEVDRFFLEQNTPSGIIAQNRGPILFGLGAYVGQTLIKLYGGEWHVNDRDPDGEINAFVSLPDGQNLLPVVRCMKRYQFGEEESIYAFVALAGERTDV